MRFPACLSMPLRNMTNGLKENASPVCSLSPCELESKEHHRPVPLVVDRLCEKSAAYRLGLALVALGPVEIDKPRTAPSRKINQVLPARITPAPYTNCFGASPEVVRFTALPRVVHDLSITSVKLKSKPFWASSP